MLHSNLWALTPDSADTVLRLMDKEMHVRNDVQSLALLQSRDESTQGKPPYVMHGGVAVITVHGVIDRVARISWWTGEAYTAGQDVIRSALDAALADTAVQAILLDVDSPGGVVVGTKELADHIATIAQKKPCAAYANGTCASAAYWLASATGDVYAPVTASVGSIGIIAVMTDMSKSSEKNGIVRTMITGGKWKAAGHPDKPLSEEERDYFQAQISQLHDIFKADVVAHMGITADPSEWAEGQTLLANDARQFGLVTALVHDCNAAIAALAAKAKTKEMYMTLEELQTQHPDLYAQAVCIGQAGAEQVGIQARESTLALVKAVAGEEVSNKVGQLAALGFTPEQIKALPSLMQASATNTHRAPGATALATPVLSSTEALTRQELLSAITTATGGPLSNGGEVAHILQKSTLVADAERLAAQQRT